jgi:putative integral membrane protein (TIGR02587 family)
MAESRSHAPSPADSLREYGRGLAGGLIFSLPLLYTMEVWWEGFIATPDRLLLYVLGVFLLLLGYNRYAGMHPGASFAEVIIDSVEEFGLGMVTASGVLFLLGRIGSGQSADEIFGKIVIEAGIVAIGFSVGTAQLGSSREDPQSSDGDRGAESSGDGESERKPTEPAGLGGNLAFAACGAALFAANVAPTEEIVVIAVETPALRLLGLALASLALTILVLYFSDFRQASRLMPASSPVEVLAGTAVTYVVALAVSAAILWFFGRFDGTSADVCLRQTIVLGFPAVLGASAGRLLLQT